MDDELLRSFVDPFARIPGVRRDGMRFAGGATPELTMAAAAKLPELRIPVLLAWGADDRFFTLADARRLQEAIPDCRLVEIAGGRTFVSLDQPDRVAAEFAGFVAERPVGASAG
jgi:pimeloyl-ACP methyl ester carboxylesterase